MTDEERKECQEWAAESRREQGLPPKVTDPEILAKAAVIIVSGRHERAQNVFLNGK